VSGAQPSVVRTPEGEYPLHIEAGALGRAGTLLRAWGLRPGAVALVTDAHVAAAWLAPAQAALRSAGFEPAACVLPPGEATKTLATVEALYERFLDAGLDRGAAVVGLGGGVIGDLSGFAAATFLRGVPWVGLPTSLLAMVDSSIGGKTGVDLRRGKNLVGAFKQPAGVLTDPDVLSTLPGEELRAGLGEVVKHALLGDPGLWERLGADGVDGDREALVARAVRVKVALVEEDPFERGRRALLNLGHTFGHAVEQVSGYRVRHGAAVAVGLVAAAALAADLGRAEPALPERVAELLRRLGLETTLAGLGVAAAPDELVAAMGHDKKRRGRTLRFVIPTEVGAAELVDDPGARLVEAALARVAGGALR